MVKMALRDPKWSLSDSAEKVSEKGGKKPEMTPSKLGSKGN